jgi:hypothetical protein
MKLLPTDWYLATITQARIENDAIFVLVFTINTGEYSYQNVLKKYPLTDWGLDKLREDIENCGFVAYTNIDDFLVEQFNVANIYAKIHVSRRIKQNEYLVNEIIEFDRMIQNPQHDVKKEKTEDHFLKGNKGRKLPINTQVEKSG